MMIFRSLEQALFFDNHCTRSDQPVGFISNLIEYECKARAKCMK